MYVRRLGSHQSSLRCAERTGRGTRQQVQEADQGEEEQDQKDPWCQEERRYGLLHSMYWLITPSLSPKEP